MAIEVLTAKVAYPSGARPFAVIRLSNAGAQPATIRAGWGRKLPLEFTTPGMVQLAAPEAVQALNLMHFGPPAPVVPEGIGLSTQEEAERNDQLILPPGGRAQWLILVPVTLAHEGVQEIPWAMPPLIAEQGGKTVPLTQRGKLSVTVWPPAACLVAAGVTVSAASVAEGDCDLLRLHFQAQAGRLPQTLDLERECVLSLQDALGVRHRELLAPGGAAACAPFGGDQLSADLELPLINGYLTSGPALAGRLQLGWSWRQWFPEGAATVANTQLARLEVTAAELAERPAQLPDGWDGPRRDDVGAYPEAGHWLAVDVAVTVTCDAQGRMSDVPQVLVNRTAR